MADRIIKPDSGNDLVLQNDDGSAKIEMNDNASIPVTGTLDVSSATLTTSTAQKESIVQAGPGTGTIDVSSGSLTLSTAQKESIVQAGPGTGTIDVSSGSLTLSTAQRNGIVSGATGATYEGSVGTSAKYTSALGYIFAKIASSVASDDEMINTTGTTNPYFTYSGDTTNIVGINNHDIKLVKKGIYWFDAVFSMYGNSGTYGGEAIAEIILRGNGSTSESTTKLAKGLGNVSESYDSTQTYSIVTLSYVGLFNANDLVNLYVNTHSGNNALIHDDSYLNICLIREVS